MAGIVSKGLDELMTDLESVADLPDEVAEAMLDAEAEIVEKAQIDSGMKMGVHRTGVMLSSITRGRMKRSKSGERVKHVYPRGKNGQGIRNAEVAFLNEYGVPSREIEPRQFIRTANEEAAGPAVDAAAAVLDDFLKSKNL